MNTEFPTYFSSKHALSMDLRDYFAAKAIDYFVRDVWLEKETDDFDDAAKKCYQMADAMMEARKENK